MKLLRFSQILSCLPPPQLPPQSTDSTHAHTVLLSEFDQLPCQSFRLYCTFGLRRNINAQSVGSEFISTAEGAE